MVMKKIFVSVFFILNLTFYFNNCLCQSGWFQQQSGTVKYLRTVFFVNSQTGWVAGDTGKILKTINGGTNWTAQDYTTTQALYAIKFLNSLTGWAVGGVRDMANWEYSLLLKTTNGGNSWQQQYPTGYNIFYDLHIFDENNIICVDGGIDYSGFVSNGNIYKSTNGGNNWMPCIGSPYLGNSFYSVSFVNANTGWAGSVFWTDTSPEVEKIFKTTNMGLNWTCIKTDTIYLGFNFQYKQNVRFIDTSNGFLLQNYLMKTTNGGINWLKTDSLTTLNAANYYFINKDTGWIISTTDIKRTNNGGNNWTSQNTPVTGLRSLYFINILTGWAVGNNGTILKTTTGGVTFVNRVSQKVPKVYFLYQNYPNPFNPITIIKFDLKEDGKRKTEDVKLVIYDVTGREIVTLVNEQLSPGTYEVTFVGNNLPSGIYFYQLHSGNFIETKKLILLK